MSDPPLFTIDYKNEISWVWTTLNFYWPTENYISKKSDCVWYALSCSFSWALLLENNCIKITWFEQSRFTIGWLWSFAEFPEFFDILEVDPWVRSAGSGLVMNPSLNFFRSLTSIGFEKNKTSIGIPQLASPWYRFWYLFKSGQPLFTGCHRFNRVNRSKSGEFVVYYE